MEDGRRGGRSWDHQRCRRHWIQVRERKTERVEEDTNYREGSTVSSTHTHRLFPLQQLLILRAMRPERITQCIIFFITTVFQHKQRK